MILSRFLHLDNHTPSVSTDDSLLLTVTETLDSNADLTGRPVKGQWIRRNKLARLALLALCLFGASAVMADGLLTPAVSVISAVTGSLCAEIGLRRHRCSGPQSQQLYRPNFHCYSRGAGRVSLIGRSLISVLASTVWNQIHLTSFCPHRRALVRGSIYHRSSQHCNQRSRNLACL